MSPLWRDEIGVYLSPHRLCLVRMRRGVRPTPAAEHEERIVPKVGDAWDAPLAALDARLGEPSWSGARTRVVFADHWARYGIVPWVATLTSTEERLAHGRELLNGLYGDAVASWDVRLSEAPPGVTRVACAVPGELIAGVRSVCLAHGNALLSLQPQLIAFYSAWRHRLPQTNAWFVSIEEGVLAAARLGKNGWDRVYGVRMGSDGMRELRRLQTFGRLASRSPQEGEVFVDAPLGWREAAAASDTGAGADGLQWLEEAAGPMTTLQRLGRSRRLAA